MTAELAFKSAHDLSHAYHSGGLSPVDVTENLFARLEQLEPVLNAFCVLDRDAALEAARASERRWKAGQPLSAIDGIPVSVKDIILTKGWPTLRGSLTISPDQPWDVDGPAVARLREAGAVIFGKTTTPEFASKPVTNSAIHGTRHSPPVVPVAEPLPPLPPGSGRLRLQRMRAGPFEFRRACAAFSGINRVAAAYRCFRRHPMRAWRASDRSHEM